MDWKNINMAAALAVLAASPAYAAGSAVSAAENLVTVDLGFMHAQYHENMQPGDDEHGFVPALGLGASVLLPTGGWTDIYTALNYGFSAGNIGYSGHMLIGGQPVNATDHATFNQIEARIGLGFPLAGGAESIPFIAGGYQSWNRNIVSSSAGGTSEFYHSGLVGMGLKLDMPLGSALVASVTGEFFGLAGGGITSNSLGFSGGFGVTPGERVELGLDEAFSGPLHFFAHADLEHFNYAGTAQGPGSVYFEPFSTTTQFGLNIGAGYRFY